MIHALNGKISHFRLFSQCRESQAKNRAILYKLKLKPFLFLLNCPPAAPRIEDSQIIGALQQCRTEMCLVPNDDSGEEEDLLANQGTLKEDEEESVVG